MSKTIKPKSIYFATYAEEWSAELPIADINVEHAHDGWIDVQNNICMALKKILQNTYPRITFSDINWSQLRLDRLKPVG